MPHTKFTFHLMTEEQLNTTAKELKVSIRLS